MIWGISMKFSRKIWTMIFLKVTRTQCFGFYLEDAFFEKPQVGVKLISPSLFSQYCQYLNFITINQWSQSNQYFLDWFVKFLNLHVDCIALLAYLVWFNYKFWYIYIYIYIYIYTFNVKKLKESFFCLQ